MLGIGEVWYFSSKKVVFSRNDDFTLPCDEQHCLCFSNNDVFVLGKNRKLFFSE
jgi:hypothetical protein